MKIINPLYLVPVALLIVLGPFVFTFWGTSFSTSMQDWAHFGTYFAGMLTPVAGLAIFWQMREKQKSDYELSKKQQHDAEQKGYITAFDLAVSRIDELLDFYDTTFENDSKMSLRDIAKGHIFYNALLSFPTYKNKIPNKGTYEHGIWVISSYLSSLRSLADRIDEKNYTYMFNMRYSSLVGELTRLGWMEKINGSKMAADADKGAQS